MRRKEKPGRKLQLVTADVDMKTYMDGNYIVADKTIISYAGDCPYETVPDHFGDITVSAIGDSAFMQSSKLRCVMLPPGLKKLGSRAFAFCSDLSIVFVPGTLSDIGERALWDCFSLADITIFDLELTAEEYYSLKNSAAFSCNGIYVTKKPPQIELVHKLAAGLGITAVSTIPDGVSMLFHLTKLDDEKGKFVFQKSIPVVGYSKPFFESKVFFEHRAESELNELISEKTESDIDQCVRMGKFRYPSRCTVFTFDDKKTREVNGKFLIYASLKTGYFFWQSSQPVIYNGKKYYIYRRHYLNPDGRLGFVRRDIAVYSDKGLVTDKKEAQEVYAKYRLLSIL